MSPVKTTLQRTLSIHFVLVAILPVLVFGVIASLLLYNHLQQEISANNQLLAKDIAISAGQFLDEVSRDMQVLAEMIDSQALADASAIDQMLEVLVKKSGYFESLYLLDSNRHVTHLGLDQRVAAQREDYRGIDYSQHTLFHGHKFLSRPVWSDTFVSLVFGEPSVTIAVPLEDRRTLLGNVSLSRLSNMLATYAKNRADLYAIVDRSGTLVAHSDEQLALQRVNFSDHFSVKRALLGHFETSSERHDGLERLESTEPIAHTGWIVWISTDMARAMAPVDHVRNLFAIGILLSALFAAGVAIFDSRRLMLPLSALSQRAGQVGAGHYEFAFTPSGFAEIDLLAGNFEQMVVAVRGRESSLIASEQRFRDLVNSIEGVVWEMDVATGRYLFVSQRAQTLLGYPAQSWLENPDFWVSRVHPDDVEQVVVRGRHSLALTESQDIEYRVIDIHGRMLWVRDLINVVWEDEEPRRLLGVMVDITERKLAEAELSRYRARLEDLVAERTRQLEEAQAELVQKERLAILGQLTATVSHEIRNPLGTVSNSLYVLRETLPSTCVTLAERPLALAERNVRRCDEIISELLDFTRRREPRCENFAIDPWLGDLLGELSWPDGLERHWHLTSGATVSADAERLRRALINIIDNALQAMEEKGADGQCLEIVTRTGEDCCEIVVRDNGAGIAEEIRDRIFEPLFSTKNFGVGLGVPIVRNIIEDHGGGVSYASKVGEGTTVTLWLPLPTDESPTMI